MSYGSLGVAPSLSTPFGIGDPMSESSDNVRTSGSGSARMPFVGFRGMDVGVRMKMPVVISSWVIMVVLKLFWSLPAT